MKEREVRNIEKSKKLHEDTTKKAPNRNVGEKRVRTQWKWTGKRMGYGRAGSSGLSWCFLKHRPRNVGYFWIQHCDSLSHAMLRNTTEEGFKDAYEHVRAETRLLIYRRHLKITGVAKNKPWILPLTQTFKRRQIFPGTHKNILTVRILFSTQSDCQMWPLWVQRYIMNLQNENWHIYFGGRRSWCAGINRAWWYLRPVIVPHSIYPKKRRVKDAHVEVLNGAKNTQHDQNM